MHVSAVQIFESGPLREDGGVDIERIRRGYESVLHLVPRYRQKLAWIPVESWPVWVDDPHFQLDYHIRHVALPHPGGLEELKRVASRVFEHPLDRNRPLWELWVVEGLQDDRFATLTKIHHCMVDGSSGLELVQRLLSPSPEAEIARPLPFHPRPMPSGAELLRDELLRRATMPLRAVQGLQALRDEVGDLGAEISTRARALADLVGTAISPVSETPLGGDLTPHRRFDWHVMSLAEVRAVRRALDCTVNDVVLAIVAEAVRRYMLARRVDPKEIRFRVAAPVSVRSDGERHAMGNRVSSWLVELPIGEPDRLKQVELLREQTRRLKETRQALGIEMLMSAADAVPMPKFVLGAQFTAGPVNTIVTNVPGPQFPLYMLGAKMLAMTPHVPLLPGMGLGIGLMSYDGRIFWGFSADYEIVPDLDAFVKDIVGSFTELAAAAGVDLGDPDRRLSDGAADPAAAAAASRAVPTAMGG